MDLRQDLLDCGRPDERLWLFVVLFQIVFYRPLQFLHTEEGSMANAFVRELAKPALPQIEPRGTGGREVKLKPAVFSQPVPHLRMLVGSIVVKDQMQIQIWRKLTVQSPHESQELLMAMVRH